MLVSSDLACSVAGITSDANVLTSELRAIAQRHRLQFGEAMPLEQLVMRLCDLKQAYTQYGGDLCHQIRRELKQIDCIVEIKLIINNYIFEQNIYLHTFLHLDFDSNFNNFFFIITRYTATD